MPVAVPSHWSDYRTNHEDKSRNVTIAANEFHPAVSDPHACRGLSTHPLLRSAANRFRKQNSAFHRDLGERFLVGRLRGEPDSIGAFFSRRTVMICRTIAASAG